MAKKMPQPIMHKVYFQASYKPELNFYNLYYSAAMQFSNYEHWETNGLHILLHDYERRCTLAIRHDSFSYNWDFGGTKSYGNDIQQATKQLPSGLDLKGFKRLGLRKQWLIAVEMDFYEINNILNVKFLSQQKQVQNIFPAGMRDMTYIAAGKDNELAVRLVLGPMRQEEIPNHIQLDQKHHFSPQRPEDYAKVLQSYPEVAIFVDIDISYSNDNVKVIESADALEFIDQAETLLQDKLTKLQNYIFASQVEY